MQVDFFGACAQLCRGTLQLRYSLSNLAWSNLWQSYMIHIPLQCCQACCASWRCTSGWHWTGSPWSLHPCSTEGWGSWDRGCASRPAWCEDESSHLLSNNSTADRRKKCKTSLDCVYWNAAKLVLPFLTMKLFWLATSKTCHSWAQDHRQASCPQSRCQCTPTADGSAGLAARWQYYMKTLNLMEVFF